MRPIERRRSHRKTRRGSFAKRLLTERLGDYCSYCERPTAYAIEHVLPWDGKSGGPPAAPRRVTQHTRLEHSWTNFLLTCVTCNNFKKERQDATPYSDRRHARLRYYWPDTDNTFRAYEYHPTGDVVAHRALAAPQAVKATRTLEMFGATTPGDMRKRKRAEAWACASLQLRTWLTSPSRSTLEAIESIARGTGHWSIWATVFAGHPDVLDRLNRTLPGTALACFDRLTGVPIARRKGQL